MAPTNPGWATNDPSATSQRNTMASQNSYSIKAIVSCCDTMIELNKNRDINQYLSDYPKHLAIITLLDEVYKHINYLSTDTLDQLGRVSSLLIESQIEDTKRQPILVYLIVTHLIRRLHAKASNILNFINVPDEHPIEHYQSIRDAFEACSVEQHIQIGRILRQDKTINMEHLWWYRLPLEWVSDEWIDEVA
jgi:hypothetical protein